MPLLTTYTIVRTPVPALHTQINLFESFLEAQSFVREHPEMIQDEIEAENVNQAETIAWHEYAMLKDEYFNALYPPAEAA